MSDALPQPIRRRLPPTRAAIIHKFCVADFEGYLRVGMFADGTPGELFITMSKEGSTIRGLLDVIGRLTSVALQSGITVETLANKFRDMPFEPSGYTQNPAIPYSCSIVDYVFRWMSMKFGEEPKPDKA